MDADFSVELSTPDERPTLEFPWSSGVDNESLYLDLKRHPELLPMVSEAALYPELGEFLQALNARASQFETAKCDVWSSDQIALEEEDYGGKWKFGSYIDVIFGEDKAAARFSFSAHEDWARGLAQWLKTAPEFPAACEAIVRRCYYHPQAAKTQTDRTGAVAPGFYLTLYISGYGNDESEARQRWGTALQLVADAWLQLSAQLPG